MIDELEFWGVDSSSGKANAEALAAAEQSEPPVLPEMHRLEPCLCPECNKRPPARLCRECLTNTLNRVHTTFTGEP